MTKTVAKWIEHACYDMETADAMLSAGRYVYVLFCCQQAIEKMLKAVIMNKTKKAAPRIHNLPQLAELAGIEADAARIDFLGELSNLYVQARYPETLEATVQPVTREKADAAAQTTKEMFQWLLSKLT